jgi:hypothetical protein
MTLVSSVNNISIDVTINTAQLKSQIVVIDLYSKYEE